MAGRFADGKVFSLNCISLIGWIVFVIGYGLDYENRFRNLPFIAVNLSSDPPLMRHD